jgi:hypothetical protein
MSGAALAFLLGATLVLASHQYGDVPTTNSFHDDIDWLTTNGITNGCSADPALYCPTSPVTRGQMAAFLHRYDTELGQTEYGVASIEVTKGDGLPIPQAAYSIPLGSPIADTTGGVFRFTCDADEAPCTIAVKAAALSDTDIGGTVLFLPRVLVDRGGAPSGSIEPNQYCEYADGAGGPAGTVALTKQALAAVPDYEDILIDIGGSADCGIAGPSGAVASIVVPEGFYDVDASFAFFTPGD